MASLRPTWKMPIHAGLRSYRHPLGENRSSKPDDRRKRSRSCWTSKASALSAPRGTSKEGADAGFRLWWVHGFGARAGVGVVLATWPERGVHVMASRLLERGQGRAAMSDPLEGLREEREVLDERRAVVSEWGEDGCPGLEGGSVFVESLSAWRESLSPFEAVRSVLRQDVPRVAIDPLVVRREPLRPRKGALAPPRRPPRVPRRPLVMGRRSLDGRTGTRAAPRGPLGTRKVPLPLARSPRRARRGRPRMPRRLPKHFERASARVERTCPRAERSSARVERLSTKAEPSSPYAEPSSRYAETSSRRAAT